MASVSLHSLQALDSISCVHIQTAVWNIHYVFFVVADAVSTRECWIRTYSVAYRVQRDSLAG